jgi:hypothetical protein
MDVKTTNSKRPTVVVEVGFEMNLVDVLIYCVLLTL